MPIIKVKAGQKIKLKEIDSNDTGQFKNKKDANKILAKNIERMAELQNVLYAEDKHALLIVLQAMDAGGKDGAIRKIMAGGRESGIVVGQLPLAGYPIKPNGIVELTVSR